MSEKPDERGRQLTKAEQDKRQRMAQGVIKPRFTKEQNQLIKEMIDIGTMARQITSTRVSITLFNEQGQLIDSQPQQIGHEELWIMVLAQRYNRSERP